MLSTRDIKRKIRSVRSIEQITQAMKTVSSIKLRKAEQRIRAARPYADRLTEMLGALAAGEAEHPFLVARPVARAGVVLISADKGLAGSFNANVIRLAAEQMRKLPQASAVTVGRRGTDAFRRMGMPVQGTLPLLGAEPRSADVAPVADLVGSLFLSGQWDAVHLVYSSFRGGAKVEVVSRQILPVPRPEGRVGGEMIYEPSMQALLGLLMPRYLRTAIFTAVLDSVASEHASRVTAMTLASENAEEMINNLTLQYNKARQATITRELIDIVGAAEALV